MQEKQKKQLTVRVGNETLSVKVIGPSPKPSFVFLHGAGIGSKERIESIAPDLVNAGISILSFDFSGQGESSGKMEDSSLKKRVKEALTVINKYADKDNLTLAGASMGAYIAIKLLKNLRAKNLILFYPSIYDAAAYNLKFNQTFTQTIRKHESWKNSDVYALLEKFKGRLLVIVGENDEVVSKEIIDLIDKNSNQCVRKEILKITDSPHVLLKWIEDKPEIKNFIVSKIVSFLS